jgi:CxxC motif-containing protein (DUF1111 family)
LTDAVRRGDDTFASIGCVGCHVPSLQTGDHEIAQLSQQTASLYSDLLLHDMGPGLADNREDGMADGTEWRTAPLWGTRLVPDFLGGLEFYLHDGRATSLDQAILAHGGEAQTSRNRYAELDVADQRDLVAFLKSL